MHINHLVALLVDQRRQFMHMIAVISIIIGVWLYPFPACGEQRGLNLIKPRAWHQDIEITNQPPAPRV